MGSKAGMIKKNTAYATRPHGIMFHHFHDEQHPTGQGSISSQQFADLIEYLGRERFLNASEWMERALSGKLQNQDLCITFDDNLRCQFDVAAPVLASYGIEAFWFVYTSVLEGKLEKLEIYRYFRSTNFENIDDFYNRFFKTLEENEYQSLVEKALIDFSPRAYLSEFSFYTDDDRKFRFIRDKVLGVERYNTTMDLMIRHAGIDISTLGPNLWMDKNCLSTLKNRGHIIGLHSHTHPTALADMTAQEQMQEYRQNYDMLSKLLGEPPQSMSHPCNSYNDSTLAVLNNLGIAIGFRANMVEKPNASHYEFPREDHTNIISLMAKR